MSEVEMLTRKLPPPVSRADLIDLLLDADELARRLLIFRALQTGALKRSEAEEIVAQVIGIERAAFSHSVQTQAEGVA